MISTQAIEPTLPTPPVPTPPVPVPTIPVPTTAAPVTPKPSESSSSLAIPTEFLGLPIWAWLALAAAVIIIIIMISALGKSGKKRSQWDQAYSMAIADSRWFADSLTLAVADRTMSPNEIIRNWNDGSPRVATLSQRLYELASIAPDAKRAQGPRNIVYAVDGLRRALDADVRMRTQGFAPGQDTLIAESAMVVGQRRNDLLAALAAAR